MASKKHTWSIEDFLIAYRRADYACNASGWALFVTMAAVIVVVGFVSVQHMGRAALFELVTRAYLLAPLPVYLIALGWRILSKFDSDYKEERESDLRSLYGQFFGSIDDAGPIPLIPWNRFWEKVRGAIFLSPYFLLWSWLLWLAGRFVWRRIPSRAKLKTA